MQGIHDPESDWEKIMRDESLFLEATAHHGVPPTLVKCLWRALQSPEVDIKGKQQSGLSIKEEIEAVLLQCPTYEVFVKMCRDNRKKGNGTGPSLFSYDMQKNWPDDVIRKVYELFVMLWESKHIPLFLKMRWIVLVPKVSGSASLNDMRPLTLVECGRKTWMSYFIKELTKKIHE